MTWAPVAPSRSRSSTAWPLRAPYMHDGCATTLADRFTKCGGDARHGNTAS